MGKQFDGNLWEMDGFMDEWMGIFDGKRVPSGQFILNSSLCSFCCNIRRERMKLKLELWLERKKESKIKYTSAKGNQSCWSQMYQAQVRSVSCLRTVLSICDFPGLHSHFIHPSWSKRIPLDISAFNNLFCSLNQFNTHCLNNRTQGKKHSLITYSVQGLSYDFKIKEEWPNLVLLSRSLFSFYTYFIVVQHGSHYHRRCKTCWEQKVSGKCSLIFLNEWMNEWTDLHFSNHSGRIDSYDAGRPGRGCCLKWDRERGQWQRGQRINQIVEKMLPCPGTHTQLLSGIYQHSMLGQWINGDEACTLSHPK